MLLQDKEYKKRSIKFLERMTFQKWNLKIYGISYDTDYPRITLINKAKEIAMNNLPVVKERNNHIAVYAG